MYTHFKECYQQIIISRIFGLRMGSPSSVVITNLVMEHVEQKAISSFSSSPNLWKRFVDDTFVIMQTNELIDFLII